MKNLLTIGSLNMDFVINTARMPKAGETVFGKSFLRLPGGKGANQAYAMAKLGGRVSMIGGVGADEDGEWLLRNLESAGVVTGGVRRLADSDTGKAFIMVDETGENSIVVIRGANERMEPSWLDENEALFDACDAVALQLEIPLTVVEYAVSKAKAKGKTVILDPAPATPAILKDWLKQVDIIKPNESELAILTGMPADTREEMVAAARELLRQGPRNVIVTLGEKGALWVTEESETCFPAPQVAAVDSTAAGDCFTAALAVQLEQGNYEEAIRFAVKASALAVTRPGAQSSIPDRMEVESLK